MKTITKLKLLSDSETYITQHNSDVQWLVIRDAMVQHAVEEHNQQSKLDSSARYCTQVIIT